MLQNTEIKQANTSLFTYNAVAKVNASGACMSSQNGPAVPSSKSIPMMHMGGKPVGA